MSWKPSVTVAAIAEDSGRFLVVEETIEGRLLLNQPAGHLEEGESLIEAVMRETLEETAWHFEPDSVCGVYLWRRPANGTTYLRVAFIGRVVDHDPERPLDDGIVRTLWLSRKELESEQHRLRSPLVLQALGDYLRGERYPLGVLKSILPS